MKPRISSARTMARNLITKYFSIATPPIPVEEIAKREGYTIEEVSDGDLRVSGTYDLKKKVLYVNVRHNAHRRRFSIAHELGHCLLGHQQERFTEISLEGNDRDPFETEANQFAAELLMPITMFKRDWKEIGAPKAISERYNVSEEAVWWRLKDLNLL
jgi:Zn-dependent peptidase ImmA (M78 family)